MGEVKLSREELSRRLRAARTLMHRDDQATFAEEVRTQQGLGVTTYGKLERGEINAEPMWLDAVAKTLGVPEWWFSATTEELLADDFPRERPDRLAHRLDRMEETLEALVVALGSGELFQQYRQDRREDEEEGDEGRESPGD